MPKKSSKKGNDSALKSGYRLKGKYFLDDRTSLNTSVPGNIFHSLRVVVDKTSLQSTKVFLDKVFIGSFKEHFVPRLKGGVFVVNKVGSVGLFQNFNLNPRNSFIYETSWESKFTNWPFSLSLCYLQSRVIAMENVQ